MSPSPCAQLFGAPMLAHGGQSTALAFERRTQLLALLALKRSWVGRAEVAALLWPDQDTRLAFTNLRKTLFRLPALPWGDCVQAQGGALRFEGSTDVAAFEAALAEGRPAEALALRRGELLAGFDDDANPAWSAWLGFERDRLRSAWRGAALGWLEHDAPAPAALALSAELLAADPYDEVALACHAGWLQRTGQAHAARQVHARFVQRLADELGLAPGAPLLALGERLAMGVPLRPGATAAAAAAAPPAAQALTAAHGPDDAGFVGRNAELQRIVGLLAQDDCRLLAVLGPGGVGKTRLVRRVLRQLAAAYPCAAFVPLEDVADSAGLGEALARALEPRLAQGQPAPPRGASALAGVLQTLRGQPALLVLDNFEGLIAESALVQQLLAQCPGLRLLVTSRVRLGLPEEWTLRLEGLPCPDAEDLDCIEAFDAVQLFVRNARRVLPEFDPAPEAAAIADICQQLGGLPLALELAAAWVRVLPCRGIAEELRAGTRLLQARDASQAPRHASLEQVFDQSWRRLADTERQVLARLTVFRGGFDAAAARAVTGASLAVLAALADKSLLHRDERARLLLHPLVLQLAAARLPAAERHDTAEAHAGHFLQLLLRHRAEAENGERAALDLLDLEGDNCRAAWQHAATGGAAASAEGSAGVAQARAMAQAWLTLVHHCDHRGGRQEGLAAAEWAARSPAAARHAPLRVALLSACAFLLHRLDRYDEAVATAQQALDLAQPDGDHDARALACRVQGSSLLRLGRLDAARERFEAALQVTADSSDPRGRVRVLDGLAMVEKRLGRYPQALQLALDTLHAVRMQGSQADVARTLNNLSDLELMIGAFDAAEQHLHEGLAICEQHGIRGTLGLFLANLTYLSEQRGDLDAAVRYGRRALQVLDAVADRTNGAATRQQLASLELRRGARAAACRELALAMRDAVQIGHPALQLNGLLVAADLLAAGDDAAARALLDFVGTHSAADAPLRQMAQERRAALPPAGPPLPWPAGLGLPAAAGLLATAGDDACDAADRLARLQRQLRPDPAREGGAAA